MKHKSLIPYFLMLLFALGACTDLEEETFGKLSPENYYTTEEEALSSVVGIYYNLSFMVHVFDAYRCPLLETDEFFIPGRTNGGWFDQNNQDLMHHQAKAENARILGAWRQVFQIIGSANAVLENLEASPNAENLTALIAETKALRAFPSYPSRWYEYLV